MNATIPLSILLALAAPHEGSASAVVCPKIPGLIAGPYVPTETVARQIFEAVAAALPHQKRAYKIKVGEESDYWAVSQVLGDDVFDPRTGTMQIEIGGGGLTMHIDKCDGTLSQVHYLR